MPDRADHVMSLMRETHGGEESSGEFGRRMRGQGAWARLLRDRFRLACRKYGLVKGYGEPLDTSGFRPPSPGGQLGFDL
jgi:hypothetical protein